MSVPPSRAPGASDPGLSFRPFVALMASLMALNALGIDSMLAALPEIGRSLHVDSENDRQWVIATYVIGFGIAQIVWGPLADRYGRKPMVFVATLMVSALSFVAGVAATFPLLLVARFLQGIAASSSRVLVVSIVRDCYEGRQMARVMSLAFMCFLVVPILAPSIGQAILVATGSWRWIFFALGGFALLLSLVTGLRLRETLHPEYRQPLSLTAIGAAMVRVATDRTAAGYTICSALAFSAIMGFINSVSQIFIDIFHAPGLFPLVFAGQAGMMGLSAFLNSRIVGRFGTRCVSQAAVIGFTVLSILHCAVTSAGYETIWTFSLLQAGTMFFFGMMGSNFGSMAMEPVGDIAGTASSIQGFFQTCLGALIGLVVSQSFNGTTIPLTLGFSVVGVAILVAIAVIERGRWFQPQHAAVAS